MVFCSHQKRSERKHHATAPCLFRDSKFKVCSHMATKIASYTRIAAPSPQTSSGVMICTPEASGPWLPKTNNLPSNLFEKFVETQSKWHAKYWDLSLDSITVSWDFMSPGDSTTEPQWPGTMQHVVDFESRLAFRTRFKPNLNF